MSCGVASLGSQTGEEPWAQRKGKLLKDPLMMSSKMACTSFLGLAGCILFPSLKGSQLSSSLSECFSCDNLNHSNQTIDFCDFFKGWYLLKTVERLVSLLFGHQGRSLGLPGSVWWEWKLIKVLIIKTEGCIRQLNKSSLWLYFPYFHPSIF